MRNVTLSAIVIMLYGAVCGMFGYKYAETHIDPMVIEKPVPYVIYKHESKAEIGDQLVTIEPDIKIQLAEPMYPITQEEIELIALVTLAEAEGESEVGQRLVIDTILNRVDHARFPDTVSGVVYQANQFTSMWNGRAERCTVTEKMINLVKEELLDRTNDQVVFFRTKRYHSFGKPLAHVGGHYFSSYE